MILMKEKIGVMGGSFNPPHNAHLFIAREAQFFLGLEKIIFIPAYQSPLKEEEITSPRHRLAMLELALKREKNFLVSDLEIKRGGKSYTVDTIRELKERWGEKKEIYFICGSDSAHTLPSWKEPETLVSLCKLVVFERPGYPLKTIPSPYRKKIIVLDSLLLDISSSDIRKRVKEGRPIRYLLPREVEEYIYQHGLYR